MQLALSDTEDVLCGATGGVPALQVEAPSSSAWVSHTHSSPEHPAMLCKGVIICGLTTDGESNKEVLPALTPREAGVWAGWDIGSSVPDVRPQHMVLISRPTKEHLPLHRWHHQRWADSCSDGFTSPAVTPRH